MASLKEKKKMKKTLPLMMVVAVLGDEDGSSWVLMKMSLEVLGFFFSKTKRCCFFEGLSDDGSVMEVENDEEDEEEEEIAERG